MAQDTHPETQQTSPRILVVTPEITYLPAGMGNMSQRMKAKAGGMADVSSTLIKALYEQGADVHVALPHYRRMFNEEERRILESENEILTESLGENRIHLAEDLIFYHRDKVYDGAENHRASLAFQREIINHIIPTVKPDLIHCNDWMTGLIPPVAKKYGIKSLITVHNIHTEKLIMQHIEDRGIEASAFWDHYYFEDRPHDYNEARSTKAVDMLTTGIFAADYVNSVSKTFLYEVIEGRHAFVPDAIRSELANKLYSGHACGILNAPDQSFNPSSDPHIENHFSADTHQVGKATNKRLLQEAIGLHLNPDAPVFYWPSRLDPMQKGCQLLAEILYQLTADYADIGLQVAIIASGDFQGHFENILQMHDLQGVVSVQPFDESLSRLAYAGSDFIIMPSRFEPCGLPQMAAPLYGTLPVVHDTGGIHDTVDHLHYDGKLGNGFRFQHYSSQGLRWAIDEAVKFFRWDPMDKYTIIHRIMNESKERFNHKTTAAAYIDLYEKILGRPVINKQFTANA